MPRQMKPRSHRLSHVRSRVLTANLEERFSHVSFTMSPEKGLDLPRGSSKMGEMRETSLEFVCLFPTERHLWLQFATHSQILHFRVIIIAKQGSSTFTPICEHSMSTYRTIPCPDPGSSTGETHRQALTTRSEESRSPWARTNESTVFFMIQHCGYSRGSILDAERKWPLQKTGDSSS